MPRRQIAVRLVAGLLMTAAASAVLASQDTAPPVVAIWYRGEPAGVPRANDLGAIRALGFTAIAWSRSDASSLDTVRRMASTVGLTVVDSDPPRHVNATSALAPGERADIPAGPAASALAWRAFAHGARTIVFDSGDASGAGLETSDRELRPWVRDALTVSRQITVNARLAQALKPAPGVLVWPDQSPDLDVVMLDGDRSWVLAVTNAGATPRKASVRLPAGTPYAIWINWLDGSSLSMIGEAPGPRWNVDIAPGAARVYLIDKVTKSP